MGVVLPAESDVRIGHVDDPVIGDRNAVSIAGQILQHVFRPAKGWFGVDHPILAKQRAQERGERLLLRQRKTDSVKGQACLRRKARFKPATNLPRNTRLSTLTGRKKRGRDEIHRA